MIRHLSGPRPLDWASEGVTFAVDEVEPATERLVDRPVGELLADRLGVSVRFADAGAERLLEDRDTLGLIRRDANPLLDAVHLAFSGHRPLVLSPDAIWLTIAQGIAQHVTLHAEGLRDELVEFRGKQELKVERDKTSGDLTQADWAEAVEEFAAQVRSSANVEALPPMLCDFSTSTPAARVASQVVLLESFKRYFDYVMVCICGFPQITLLGTPADWDEILTRAGQLSKLGLGFWAEKLVPVCEQFVVAASGRPDRDHWKRMYKLAEAYGTKEINGWFTYLFPYVLDDSDTPTTRNPVLVGQAGHLYARQIPKGLSKVPVRVEEMLTGESFRLQLVAGLTGVVQDPETLALSTAIGWAIAEGTRIDRALEVIRTSPEHVAAPREADVQWWHFDCSAELVELMSDFESVTLFAEDPDNRIVLDGPRDPIAKDGIFTGLEVVVGRGPLGHELLMHCDRHGGKYGFPICLEAGDDKPLVIAESLGELLDRCLAEGAFFARDGFEPLRRLGV